VASRTVLKGSSFTTEAICSDYRISTGSRDSDTYPLFGSTRMKDMSGWTTRSNIRLTLTTHLIHLYKVHLEPFSSVDMLNASILWTLEIKQGENPDAWQALTGLLLKKGSGDDPNNARNNICHCLQSCTLISIPVSMHVFMPSKHVQAVLVRNY
jgi:hypothetical protein